MRKYVAIIAICAALNGCDEQESSDKKMNRQQEQLSREASQQVPLPAIINFTEKRMMKDILELRDKTISTTAYIVAENTGQLFKLCDSIGYGLPYASQFTNPSKVIYDLHGNVTVPQADPNGLFSPAGADGTWIMCLDPVSKKTTPVFVEPKVIVSPFPIQLTPVPFANSK